MKEQPKQCHRFLEIMRNIELHTLADYREDPISQLHLASRRLWMDGREAHLAECKMCGQEKR